MFCQLLMHCKVNVLSHWGCLLDYTHFQGMGHYHPEPLTIPYQSWTNNSISSYKQQLLVENFQSCTQPTTK